MTRKVIMYKLCTTVDHGTPDCPQWENVLFDVELAWSEANEEIAKREAYNGEYSILNVEVKEPERMLTQEERIQELEEALALLLSGDTE